MEGSFFLLTCWVRLQGCRPGHRKHASLMAWLYMYVFPLGVLEFIIYSWSSEATVYVMRCFFFSKINVQIQDLISGVCFIVIIIGDFISFVCISSPGKTSIMCLLGCFFHNYHHSFSDQPTSSLLPFNFHFQHTLRASALFLEKLI